MNPVLNFPSDEFAVGTSLDIDLAADFLELSAFYSKEGQSFSEDIVNALELAAEAEYGDVDDEVKNREEVAASAVARMAFRKQVLATSYPFDIDANGDVIFFTGEKTDLGHTAYLVSLILSNLNSVSPLLVGSDVHPTEEEVSRLRRYFQYLATAAVAAEVGGPAWSFGFPRPDQTGFLPKLREIWESFKDGIVDPDPSAPTDPKDDGVDIFAWREQKDGLPGFLLLAAQVATGRDWKEKSIKFRVGGVFQQRWFRRRVPVTAMVAYHVIPFARPDEKFRDDVLMLGNVLHRLRVPFRVSEATSLVSNGVAVEAFDQIDHASEWIQSYGERTRPP
ncbi:MAG: hypothetical protein F4Y42_02685 [Caldilineaceae bacterium SB0664_bin_27]|uniref:Uncharacterized protein n=1 Tax=Caldilineaceae bacterium SB0664_bin_27 TaxID=2605260 RepID=A0A6B0YMR2_9CHLR|nr:hypothetical protein [Caldilineaceae bacterium SB0664_bin_27]